MGLIDRMFFLGNFVFVPAVFVVVVVVVVVVLSVFVDVVVVYKEVFNVYSVDLNTGIVCYSKGPNLTDCSMLPLLRRILIVDPKHPKT